MKRLAVIGKDVSQSVSPQIHSFIARSMGVEMTYEKLSISEAEFESRAEELFTVYDGFNVTIPYKLTVIPHLREVVGDARTFGAVNTVLTATRQGFNTDGLGFGLMLKLNGIEVKGAKALLLGAGGAGRSVAKKLVDGGAAVEVYDRYAESANNLAREFAGVTAIDAITAEKRDLIINATGVGMHNSVGVSPVGEEIIRLCASAVDLIYVPEKSEFLRLAELNGKKIVNGMAMLFYQAYYSDCIYFNLTPSESQALKLFNEYLKTI